MPQNLSKNLSHHLDDVAQLGGTRMRLQRIQSQALSRWEKTWRNLYSPTPTRLERLCAIADCSGQHAVMDFPLYCARILRKSLKRTRSLSLAFDSTSEIGSCVVALYAFVLSPSKS